MGDRPHCLALVSDAFGGHGGIAQYNRDLMTAFAASGYFGSICVLPRRVFTAEAPPQGVQQLPPKGRTAFALTALSLAATRSLEIVFCGHVHLAPLAAFIARARGAKLVVQTHGIEVWTKSRAAWRSATEKSDIVLCVSRYTRQIVLNQIDIAPDRALVLSNTVGEAFTPGDSEAFRRQHGLANKRVLLTVGRLDSRERYKGQDRVIASIPRLLAQGHDVIYLIVGGGDDRARLEQCARDAGIGDRVRFLGALEADELVDVYRAADLFVMPSTGEGFGISFLEAMACGTPALGLGVAGAPDALADGALGTMVTEENLSETIDRLLHAPVSNRQALADSVRARFGRKQFRDSVNAMLARLHPGLNGQGMGIP